MVAEIKPPKVARWNDDLTNQTEPSEGKKDVGWVIDEAPPSSFFNFLLHFTGRWQKWFTQRFFDGAAARDLVVKGVDADAGVDQDGGDLDLSGGDATGDVGSEMRFLTAQAGLGSSSTVSPAVLRGKFRDDGVLDVFEGLEVAGAPASAVVLISRSTSGSIDAILGQVSSGGAGSAIIGNTFDGIGYAAELVGKAIGPVKSPLRIKPSTAVPTVALVGDFFVTVAGVFKICTVDGDSAPTAPTFVTVGEQTAVSAIYARLPVVVEDRTLLESAQATATNNNNVLAAIIADLKAVGILG